eukprot:TRINITY_DN1051_c8_g1_i1.p1 TRINITY_DN1051_c8_g1~~TRINITY_DN1051_c8_g1_i1.p1  ORF type:complete len:105 (+),score=0.77 TRINITY_DN1051_c8_g1_i1:591-905(+)
MRNNRSQNFVFKNTKKRVQSMTRLERGKVRRLAQIVSFLSIFTFLLSFFFFSFPFLFYHHLYFPFDIPPDVNIENTCSFPVATGHRLLAVNSSKMTLFSFWMST